MKNLYFLFVLLFSFIFVYGRFLLMNSKGLDYSFESVLGPVLKDIIFLLLLVALCYWTGKLNKWLPYLISVPFIVFHLVNIEYIYAMNNVVNLKDISYASDTEFLKGSLSGFNFPLYYIIITISLIGTLVTGNLSTSNWVNSKKRKGYIISGISVLILLMESILVLNSSNDWKESNFTYASLNNSVFNLIASYKDETIVEYPVDIEDKINSSKKIDNGNLLLSDSKMSSKNVLIVTMEGLTGAYVPEIQNYFGIDNTVKMKSFEKIKNHSIVVPNFLTHNNQTIRGLYSLLGGDYPKLDASTPKAYEYMGIEEASNRSKLLPQLLKDKGYNTAFIQAAPIEFMSKDQFMSAAGFDTIIGEEGFSYKEVPFAWGVDDKAFFKQAQDYLNELNSKGEPWFATLLTVGTHHPYAVPDEYSSKYSDRKEASVNYLDDSLSDFIDYINASDFANDTLVLFVSDESHGVDNQPYGSNWGICIAYAPNIQSAKLNTDVFGHKDILNSVMDFIDAAEWSSNKGRSIFREYNEDSPVIFATHYNGEVFYSTQKGIVYQVNNKNELYKIESNNHEMFATKYSTSFIDDERLRDEILLYKKYTSSSLGANDKINIISSKEFDVKTNQGYTITEGQFITLPAKKYVTIGFDYEIVNPEPDDSLRFIVETNEDKIIRKTVTDKGHLNYNFYNEEKQSGYSFSLDMTPFLSSLEDSKKVKINNLIMKFESENSKEESIQFDTYDKGSLNNMTNLIPFMSTQLGAHPTEENHINILSEANGVFLVYGPYLTYPKGKHSLIYKFKMNEQYSNKTTLLTLDISTDGGENIVAIQNFSPSDFKRDGEYYIAELPFEIDGDVSLEFRLRGQQNLDLVVEEIYTTTRK